MVSSGTPELPSEAEVAVMRWEMKLLGLVRLEQESRVCPFSAV